MTKRRASGERTTISDVAREAGVSTQTVSRVLNNKGEITPATRQLVEDVIRRLGYRPSAIARSLVTRRTLSLGLVVPDITNPVFPEIARGAEEIALAAGYNVFLCNTIEQPARETSVLRSLEEKRVDGVVVCSSRLPDDQLFPALRRQQAAVLVNRPAPPELAGTVRIDDAGGSALAVGYLCGRGRRRLGMLSGPVTSFSGKERTRGFLEAARTSGAAVDPVWLRSCAPTLDGGYEAARSVLSSSREIQALLCYNDLVAVGAIQACRDLGIRVPDDLAVVGCDDIQLACLVTPALTTLRSSKFEVGAAAVRMLLNRIEGVTVDAEVVMEPELIVRASAG